MQTQATTIPVGVMVVAVTTASEVSTAARAASPLEFLEKARTPRGRWFPTNQARRHRSAPRTAGSSATAFTASRLRLEHRQTLNRPPRSPPQLPATATATARATAAPTPETGGMDFLRSPQPLRSPPPLAQQLLLVKSVSRQQPPPSAMADSTEKSALPAPNAQASASRHPTPTTSLAPIAIRIQAKASTLHTACVMGPHSQRVWAPQSRRTTAAPTLKSQQARGR
jgi:hypothetical protein